MPDVRKSRGASTLRQKDPKNVLETLKGWVIYMHNSPGSWVFSPPPILLRMWRGQDSTSSPEKCTGIGVLSSLAGRGGMAEKCRRQ